MESTTMYLVHKFFPPKCPKCNHPFRSANDFGLWGGQGSSFSDALGNQRDLFPEIFPKTVREDGIIITQGSRFNIDFIICINCKNTTMRIAYATRQVGTIEEAEDLISKQGFTYWHEVQTFGNMARPYETLAMLAQADLALLNSSVIKARKLAASEEDDETRINVFETTLDPVLVATVKKYHEKQVMDGSRKRLKAIFGESWRNLDNECRQFLMTAELVKDELISYAENDPDIDFTPAVQMYSKALEKELLEKLFVPFRTSQFGQTLPRLTERNSLDRSIKSLKGFVEGSRKLTLGDMAFCLRNVGCKMQNETGNGYSQFLSTHLNNIDGFCEIVKLPSSIIKYNNEFRIRAAHVSRITRNECFAARAYLLEEPICLLIKLQKMLQKPAGKYNG